MSESPKKESVQEFLARIGPRELTGDEARYLHILRIREGKSGTLGVIEKLAAEARKNEPKK